MENNNQQNMKFFNKDLTSTTINKDKELDKRLMNIFLSVGISAHLNGYHYLRESIKITMEHPEYINCITKKLYPIVAEKFSTTACRVERGMRNALEVAYEKGKLININQIFGLNIIDAYERPTNSEFVALIADRMMIESK
ncbi:MAG: sporulation initiation factor Spo0A C-terminal domain-containing protein [Clostridia bacterium]|nr:sporulation initiation factor Spo0A C-terminal domain-containing protein [Clostridia bacterium]